MLLLIALLRSMLFLIILFFGFSCVCVCVCMFVDVCRNNIKYKFHEIYINLLWSLKVLWDYANCQGLFSENWSECLWALINYLIYDKLLIALNFAYSIQGAVWWFLISDFLLYNLS